MSESSDVVDGLFLLMVFTPQIWMGALPGMMGWVC